VNIAGSVFARTRAGDRVIIAPFGFSRKGHDDCIFSFSVLVDPEEWYITCGAGISGKGR
jgi:hypothetical protein